MTAPNRRDLVPLLVLALMVAAMIVWPAAKGATVDAFSVFNILLTFATFGLVALAVGLSVMAGELDISTVGAYVLGGVLAVELGADAPLLGMAIALGVGLVAGVVQGAVVARMGLSSLPVTLGGALVLTGIAQAVADQKLVQFGNQAFSTSFDRRILDVLSPRVLVVAGIFVVAALVLHRTRLGRHVRAVGSDRRASRAAGVRVGVVLTGVFGASGALAALGGAMSAIAVAGANPEATFNPLIFGLIAILVGGVGLAGGSGTVVGIAAGTLALATLQQTLAIVSAPDYVAGLVVGSLLFTVAVATAPELLERLALARRRRAARHALEVPSS